MGARHKSWVRPQLRASQGDERVLTGRKEWVRDGDGKEEGGEESGLVHVANSQELCSKGSR